MRRLEVFSTYNTDKVLRDKPFPGEKKLRNIFVKAVKNSYELAQVFVTPNFSATSCEFSLSRLVDSDGTVFDENNVEFYYQKYIEVKETSWKETNGEIGWFPDVLLPYDTAVKCRENRIEKGENQALLMVFHILPNQKCGIYEGRISISVDGEKSEFPIAIEVSDVTLPKVQKSDSLFCMEYEFVERGEQDYTLEMKEGYVRELLKYKQVPRLFPQASDSPDDFVNAVRKYYDIVPGFSIPMDVAKFWGAPRYYDGEFFKSNVFALAKACLEDGVNYFEKARNYLVSVDEPLQNNVADKASSACKKYREALVESADKFENSDFPDGILTKKEIAQTIRNKVFGLMTSSYTDKISGVDIWCPPYKSYTDSEKSAKYKESGKPFWGYTCNAQTYPLPNYHIDDMNSFLSSRVLGTIMRDYGVRGNLYYETVFFERLSYKNGLHLEPTDAYSDSMKYPGTNGDGFLFYPGRKYGVKSPIASNRLSYIRDAVQDYDLLWLLEEEYEKYNKDARPLLESIFGAVHKDTEVTISSIEFFKLKSAIIDAVILAREGKFYKSIEEIF